MEKLAERAGHTEKLPAVIMAQQAANIQIQHLGGLANGGSQFDVGFQLPIEKTIMFNRLDVMFNCFLCFIISF